MEPAPDPWLRFAFEAARVGAHAYSTLARFIAQDSEIRALAAHAQLHQPHPNVLFGAVHFLLLRGEPGDIRRYYRTLGGEAPVDDGLWPAFREFCVGHVDRLIPIIQSRVTNTNEVGRSSLLHLGFRELARHAPEPLHLVEIGPSAGINMFWDRFGYRFTQGGETFVSGAPDARLVLEAELRGKIRSPVGPSPAVGSRIGLERNPVDLSKQENRDWLRALVWSDHRSRLERLERALATIADETPDIRAGDAPALLPDTLASIPQSGTVCVYHTIVTYQFTPEERSALVDLLAVAGLRRPIWRLFMEGTPDLVFPLTLERHANGEKSSGVLAHCNAHGGWIEWLEEA